MFETSVEIDMKHNIAKILQYVFSFNNTASLFKDVIVILINERNNKSVKHH